MNENFPRGLKDWNAIHEAIEQHGTKAFNNFRAEMKAETAELKAAVKVHGKVKDIEKLHGEAEKALGDARTEAQAMLVEAEATITEGRDNLSKARATFKKQQDKSQAEMQERSDKVLRRENAATAREEGFVQQGADAKAEDDRLAAERTRLGELSTDLAEKGRQFEKAKTLMGA